MGTISVVNNSRRAISVHIDGEALFFDILPGEHTKRKPVPPGTRNVQILNSREKILADIRISVAKNIPVVLKITGTKD